jgi:hypothetical protein
LLPAKWCLTEEVQRKPGEYAMKTKPKKAEIQEIAARAYKKITDKYVVGKDTGGCRCGNYELMIPSRCELVRVIEEALEEHFEVH